jgi:hypothetical protein
VFSCSFIAKDNSRQLHTHNLYASEFANAQNSHLNKALQENKLAITKTKTASKTAINKVTTNNFPQNNITIEPNQVEKPTDEPIYTVTKKALERVIQTQDNAIEEQNKSIGRLKQSFSSSQKKLNALKQPFQINLLRTDASEKLATIESYSYILSTIETVETLPVKAVQYGVPTFKSSSYNLEVEFLTSMSISKKLDLPDLGLQNAKSETEQPHQLRLFGLHFIKQKK